MEKYNKLIISRSKFDNTFLLIPKPFINDIHEIIQEFNEVNDDIEHGHVYMDLQTIVGNRKKKYVSMEIINYRLLRNTKSIFNNDHIKNELFNLKATLYQQLDSKIISDLTMINP